MQKQLMTILALVGAAACGDDGHPQQTTPDAPEQQVDAPPAPTCTPQALRTDLTWYGSNRTDLTNFLASKGCLSAGYDKTNKPVATFDWDNTISKNDFGDAFTFYLVANDKILQPPSQDWKQTSAYMTDAGAAALTAACGTTVAAGSPLPTGSTNTACGQEILSMYIDNKTTAAAPTPGATAFSGTTLNPRWIEPTYAWTAQLAAGYTHAEVQAMATAAITPQLSAAENSPPQTVAGRTGLNSWLRIYDQSKDLIAVAQSYGYDVWIITASPQDVIEAFAPMAGVPADHVIGIRSKTESGKLNYSFEGCGAAPDSNQALIPYIQGKRCWINKVIYGDTTAAAMQRRAEGQRQVFAAGDSDTDIEFLRDATYRLVINRNKTELMCHAYYNSLGTWRINPMFIGAKPMKSSQYACSTTCMNGVGTACLDDANNVIPNQSDGVY